MYFPFFTPQIGFPKMTNFDKKCGKTSEGCSPCIHWVVQLNLQGFDPGNNNVQIEETIVVNHKQLKSDS